MFYSTLHVTKIDYLLFTLYVYTLLIDLKGCVCTIDNTSVYTC